jgi:hypothetical protein
MAESPVQSARGAGIYIPPRKSDCTGRRPSWFPLAVNVCDWDAPDPVELTARHLTIGEAKPIPWDPTP